MERLGNLYLQSDSIEGRQVMHRYINGDGVIAGWGLCREGELGTGTQYNVLSPFMIGGHDKPIRVSCASMSSAWLGIRNLLITMGSGMWGELAVGNPRSCNRVIANDANMPICIAQIDVPPFTPDDFLVDIEAGHSYFTCVSGRGHLYAWGANNYGQCHPKLPNACCGSPQLRQIPGERCVEVACCNFAVFGRMLSGAIYGWGLSRLLGSEESLARDMSSGEAYVTLHEVEDRKVLPTPTRLSFFDDKDIVRIRAGPWHAAAISRSGTVYTWGLGNNGRLGHGSEDDAEDPTPVAALSGRKIVEASCGSFHTVFVAEDGTAFACGDNQSGQCGARGSLFLTVPEAIRVSAGRRVIHAACGRHHTLLLLETGEQVAYGSGLGLGIGFGYGMQLAHCQPVMENYTSFWVVGGKTHNFSLTFPKNTAMIVLGLPHRGVPSSTMSSGLKEGILSCGVGVGFTLMISRRGSLYSFGVGGWGQLGFDASQAKLFTPERVPVVPNATRVPYFARTVVTYAAAGYSFGMAIVEGERVYSWGNNSWGQCGLGYSPKECVCVRTPQEITWLADKMIIQVACGSYFALALSCTGEVYSWGVIECCGVGLQPDPAVVPPHMIMRDVGSESVGVVLSPVLIPHLSGIVHIAAGGWHALALNSVGEIYAWGIGTSGRLGLGDVDSVYTPTRIKSNTFFTRIGCSFNTSYGVDDEARLFVWGANDKSQLGVPRSNKVVSPTHVMDRVRDVGLGKNFTVVLTFDNTFHMSGVMECQDGVFQCTSFHDGEHRLPESIRPATLTKERLQGIRLYAGLEHVVVLCEKDPMPASSVRAAAALMRTQPEKIVSRFKGV